MSCTRTDTSKSVPGSLLAKKFTIFNFQVHKEAHYKNGTATTPIKKVVDDPVIEEDKIGENTYNDDEYEYDHESNEIAVDEEDDQTSNSTENEREHSPPDSMDHSPPDSMEHSPAAPDTGVMDESLKYSMGQQDSFIDDGTVARVI